MILIKMMDLVEHLGQNKTISIMVSLEQGSQEGGTFEEFYDILEMTGQFTGIVKLKKN